MISKYVLIINRICFEEMHITQNILYDTAGHHCVHELQGPVMFHELDPLC